MNDHSENTVSAKGQMVNTDTLRYYGNPEAKKRILIVGNSITRHGPLASIGWERDWGMAASSEEKDYVHLLMRKWKARGVDYFLCVDQLSCWEVMLNEGAVDLSVCRDARAFHADVVIFRLAENIGGNIDRSYFKKQLQEFLDEIAPPDAAVIMTTPFWENKTVEEEIRALARERNYALADLVPLGAKSENKAYGLFSHSGVCAHPGDEGMRAIAEKIDEAFLSLRN